MWNPQIISLIANDWSGVYRMRFKVDWCCLDAGGNDGSDGTNNQIWADGGGIVDVLLKVTGVDEVPVSASSYRNGTIWNDEGVQITSTALAADYNKPHIAFVADTNGTVETNKVFGALNYSTKEYYEPNGQYYLGRSSSSASFAGNPSNSYFTSVNPNEAGATLNIKVDYTLVATDGSGETINIKGAAAQVPAKYTSWQPGYSYTYLFKIYDLSWGGTSMNPEEMFPITLDGVVIEEVRSPSVNYEW